MIFVSTGGYKDKDAIEVVKYFINQEIFEIELSGGKFCEDVITKLSGFKNQVRFYIHNYFPPPKKPFVLNLASLDADIYEKTIDYMKRSIMYAKELGSRYYSFHAGFLIDPKVNELGEKIPQRKLNNRLQSKDLFINRVNDLAKFAYAEDIVLLVENNVLSEQNFKEFKENPLLMVDTEETIEIMSNLHRNVGLLLDVAHLKVSSFSLNFAPDIFLSKINDYIKGYHLSDNNGLADTNSAFDENSWFWPYLKKDIDYYSIEVYNTTFDSLKKMKELAKLKLGL